MAVPLVTDPFDAFLESLAAPAVDQDTLFKMAAKDIEATHPQLKFGMTPFIEPDSDVLHANGFIGNDGNLFVVRHKEGYAGILMFTPDGETPVLLKRVKFGPAPEEGWPWGSVVLMFDLLIQALPEQYRFAGQTYDGPYKGLVN